MVDDDDEGNEDDENEDIDELVDKCHRPAGELRRVISLLCLRML